MFSSSGIKRAIKKPAYAVIRAFPWLRKAVRKVSRALGEGSYRKLAASTPTQGNAVLFVSFRGRSYSDSPRAVFEAMLKDGRFEGFEYYWEFRGDCIESYRYLEELPNVHLVQRSSRAADEAFARCKYWVSNGLSPDNVTPKDDQVYVQCWHGTPLKRLGCDIPECTTNAMNTAAEMNERYHRESAKWSKLVSPSPFTTESLSSAFDLDPAWARENVLELGYPRNDAIVNTCADPEQLSALKQRLCEELGFPADKKLLLYAPTWRDNEYKVGVGYVQDVMIDFDMLQRELSDEWAVLFRPHYFVASQFDFSKYGSFVVNAASLPDINELYCIADAIMTDYSSVFFDFACTKRPLFFYMPDLEEYANELHGFYLDPQTDLPGPLCATTAEVVDALRGFDSYFDTYGEQYAAFQERFCPHEDGQAAQRLIEAVFFENQEER